MEDDGIVILDGEEAPIACSKTVGEFTSSLSRFTTLTKGHSLKWTISYDKESDKSVRMRHLNSGTSFCNSFQIFFEILIFREKKI